MRRVILIVSLAGLAATGLLPLPAQAGAAPSITLTSPQNGALFTSGQPTFAGTASSLAATQVTVKVYAGATTSGSPTETLTTSRSPLTGAYAVGVSAPLPDGQYTAQSQQDALGGGSTSFSNETTFRIKTHSPALTLTQPAPGSKTKDQAPVLGGAAGNALGDSTQVSVALWAGAKATGKPVGRLHITRAGASWSATWPEALQLGRYTAQAKQSDDAGHTALTAPDTFQIVRGPSGIGVPVTLARHGRPNVSVPITCLAPAGQTCAGDVLIITSRRYRPMPAGPTGQLRVLFAYVTMSGGQTLHVTGRVSSEVARILRHRAPVKVEVSASLSATGGATSRYLSVRTLRLAS